MVETAQNISKITIYISEMNYPLETQDCQTVCLLLLKLYILYKRHINKTYTYKKVKGKKKKYYIDKY